MAEIAFGDGGLALAERFSFALIPHVGRARAQELVKQAALETRASGRPLAETLTAISDARSTSARLPSRSASVRQRPR
ncbi:MAG: hypothetical protein HPM95_03605 [Alphaproteobacteria bacterium]|nr:hypothetical protein [Alphaproteobacteria bacterium]